MDGLLLRFKKNDQSVDYLLIMRDRYALNQSVQASRFWERAYLLATIQDVAARPSTRL